MESKREEDGDKKQKKMSPALEKAYAELKEGMTDTQKAYTLQKVAKTMVEAYNYPAAIEVLSHAIDAAHVANFFTQRAQCYKALQKWTEAYFDYSFAARVEPENTSHYIQRGMVLTKLYKFDLALEDMCAAVEMDSSPNSYYQRGLVYNEMGNYLESIADFTISIEKDAANAMPNQVFQCKVLNQRALAFFNKGDMQPCIDDLKVVLLKDPNDHKARQLQARAYKLNAELDMAEESIDYCILHEEKEPLHLIERGDIRYRMGVLDKTIEAIHDFDNAIKFLNEQKYAYEEATQKRSLGNRRLTHSTSIGGMASLSNSRASSPNGRNASISVNPNQQQFPGTPTKGTKGVGSSNNSRNASPTNSRPASPERNGNVVQGKQERIGRQFFKGPGALDVMKWSAHFADVHMRRAQAKLWLKHNPDVHAREALHDLQVATKLFPDNESYRLTLTICQIRLNQNRDAQKSITKVLELNPRNDRALFHKAFCLTREGELKEAIAQLSRIINVHDGEDLEVRAKELHGIPLYRVYEMRATLLHELMAYKLALVDFGRALTSEPDNATNYYLRGDCHSKLGNYEQAYNDFISADMHGFVDRIALCSARGQVTRLLGDSLRAEKDFEEALSIIKEIREEAYRREHMHDPPEEDEEEEGEGGDEEDDWDRQERVRRKQEEQEKKEKAGGEGDEDTQVSLPPLPPTVDYFEEVRIMSLRALCLIDKCHFPKALGVLHEARTLLRNEEEHFEEMGVKRDVNDDAVELAYNAHKRLEWTIMYHLSQSFHALRRFKDSVKFLGKCVDELKSFAPDSDALGSAIFFCGVAENHLGRFVGAEGKLTECLETAWVKTADRNFAMAKFARGKARQGLGDHTHAIEDFSSALAIYPKDAYILFRRAWSHKSLSMLDAAASDFEEAKNLSPHDPNFAVDYKKIRNFEYMCLDEESDFTHPFQSLLRVPIHGQTMQPALQPPTPRFFSLDASRESRPIKPRLSPLRKGHGSGKTWAAAKSPAKSKMVY